MEDFLITFVGAVASTVVGSYLLDYLQFRSKKKRKASKKDKKKRKKKR